MPTINDTFINALLADSAYVIGLFPELTGNNLTDALAGRMTPQLAGFIGDNFTVVTQVGGLASSFDATVWRGNVGTPYAGRIYVSMRGTQEGPDFTADTDLAASGLAHRQLVDMVNWWLRETMPASTGAGTPLYATQIALSSDDDFVLGPSVQGTGRLADVGAIASVNGHSLGGYLASAFVRIFGSGWPVGAINTFNSAGFSRLAASNIENGFGQIALLVGAGLGVGNFSSAQNNYFALNGINVTTNTWNPVGFQQYGVRTGMYQEDLTPGIINNHFMYKLTDLLSLGNALTKLDASFDLARLSAMVSAGSNQMVASYEGVLDGFRRVLVGTSVTSTSTGDDNGPNAGPQPAARLNYHVNLAELQGSSVFQALAGQLRIAPSHDWMAAQTDFAALLSLTTGATFSMRLNDPSPTSQASLALYGAQRTSYERWLADINHRAAEPYAEYRGGLNFSSMYLSGRALYLNTLTQANVRDQNGFLYNPSLTTQFLFEDKTTDSVLVLAPSVASTPYNTPLQRVVFGGGGFDFILGYNNKDPLSGQDSYNEYLFGGDGSDVIQGQDGRDWIEGGAGNDYDLSGGAGWDMVLGGEGDDTMYVAAGLDNFDSLYGGRGFDTYAFERGATQNGIFDSDGLGSKVFESPGFNCNDVATVRGLRRTDKGNHWRFRDIRPIAEPANGP